MSTADGEPSVTAKLVELGRSFRFEDLPEEIVTVASQCVLDGLGCAIAGSREPATEILLGVVGSSTDGSTDGSTLIGRSERARLLDAALVNGLAAHALDFDDTHSLMSGHPTVPVLPAVLALAERDRRSGADLLTAFVAGVEVECRLGALVNPEHYRRGFHATATCGTVGAAAAAAWLLDLDERAWGQALGLAATQAAGLKSSFGTMAKPLHAGRAAQAGLLAARLAAAGFTGAAAAVGGPQGLCDTLGGGDPDPSKLAALDGRFLIRDTLFKYHAACYLTHSVIEGVRRLRSKVPNVDDVDQIEVRVAPGVLRVCNIENPTTGLESKFSLRATAAMALLGDATDELETYSDERAVDPGHVAVRERVRITAEPGLSQTRSVVRVRLQGGDAFEEAIDVGEAAEDLFEQGIRLGEKFGRLVGPVLGSDVASRLRLDVLALPVIGDATDLIATLRLPG